MNVCTAVGAIDSKKNYTITFKSEAHKIFYLKYLPECRYQDVYHKALVYCLGIDADTRNHVNSIYDFKTGCVKTKCLNEGWQNSGSIKIVRMAFNLYCNGTPSVVMLISHISVVSKKKIKICFTYQDEFDDMCYLIQKMKGEHEIWQG